MLRAIENIIVEWLEMKRECFKAFDAKALGIQKE